MPRRQYLDSHTCHTRLEELNCATATDCVLYTSNLQHNAVVNAGTIVTTTTKTKQGATLDVGLEKRTHENVCAVLRAIRACSRPTRANTTVAPVQRKHHARAAT